MNKNWILNKNYDPNSLQILHKKLTESLKTPPANEAHRILAKLMLTRGISTIPEAKAFTNFSMDKLHDPFMMLNMDHAVNRILKAIDNNEKIMVYGDYDVDGTTSVALMTSFLTPLSSNLSYYIPDRYNEGYGISMQGIDHAIKNNIGLIIALDCGIKAVDKIEYANSNDVDFIICDHHMPGKVVPNAVAVLDPKQKNCNYPYKELSGCAIGYKLCQALSTKTEISSTILTELLDLTAISLACDIVPLTGENRNLIALGLQVINTNPRLSIVSLLGEKHPKKMFNVTDLVFSAGPKINAAGRISSGKTAVDLLLATEQTDITNFANEIDTYNLQRKSEDKRITLEALEQIKSNPDLINKNTSVLYQSDWHKGVIGIVASRVIENYYRPTVILTKSKDDVIAGSVRSVKGFDVYAALEECQNEMLQFGGHKYAAGLTMKENQLEKFTAKFEKVVTKQMETKSFIPEITIDAEVPLAEITTQLKAFVDKLSPFGPKNMTPTFATKNVIDTGNSKIVGADNTHLKLEVNCPKSGYIVQGIAFGFGFAYEKITSGIPFDLAYTIDINYWKDRETLQIMVKDIKFQDTQ